jgi:alkanesulfonate monooxygenase SsuD/methylene tetrahydromethanopterin reductase-like flavin-dependent oxidoreductase (luciferase family)
MAGSLDPSTSSNIVLNETDAQAQRAMELNPARAPFSLAEGVATALLALDARNIAGEARSASVNRVLPINFFGGPDTVVDQFRRCREVIGAGVIDLGFNTPGTTDPDALLDSLDLFGRTVLPRIRDI